jgi:hypothetical protein
VCGNVEVPLEALLAQGSAEPEALVTVTWSAASGAPASVVGGPVTDVVVRPTVAPGQIKMAAVACDVSGPSFASVTLTEFSLWTTDAATGAQ